MRTAAKLYAKSYRSLSGLAEGFMQDFVHTVAGIVKKHEQKNCSTIWPRVNVDNTKCAGKTRKAEAVFTISALQ